MENTNENNGTEKIKSDDEIIDETARFILEKYKEAFKELAK